MRTADRLLVPVAAVVAAVRIALVALLPYDRAVGLFDDDAFYYFGVARHVAAGDGSTFNGLDPTNGYHPLWELVLTPVFAVADGRAALVLTTALAGALFVLSAALLRTLGPGALVASAPLLVAGSVGPSLWFSGMETALLLTALVAVGVVAARPAPTVGRAAVLGVLMGVAVLARLDVVFGMGLLGLLLAWRVRRPALVAAIAAPPAALLGAYLLVNTALFGTAMPVSGQAKALGGGGSFDLDVARQFLAAPTIFGVACWFGLAALVLVPVALLADRGSRRAGRAPVAVAAHHGPVAGPDARHEPAGSDTSGRQRRHEPAGGDADGRPAPAVTAVEHAAVVLAGGLATVVYYTVTSSWQLWPWYFYAAPLSLALALPALLRRIPARRAPDATWRTLGLVTAALVLAVVAVNGARTATGDVQRAAFVSGGPAFGAALDALPGDAPFAMGDRAGSVGFHTRRPLVHLEGLVNSPEYLRAMRDGTVARFLAERGVQWYARGDAATGAPRGDGCAEFSEPAQGAGPKTSIVVCDADLVHIQPLADGTAYRVWRYRPELNA